uniref:ATP synthase complex subunit 8 n=1 Tax=Cucujoidea sp. 42 KM-2017 TaxID=2219381 RepID=A0A346RJ06_9CUCU|nr:ATP synthase F0 subunit 8 [Cucujoidea sp. 42 KM-2017]
MPQMMPLNWLSLMTFFILIFFLINIISYFNYSPSLILQNLKNSKKSNINWKW